MGRWSKEFMKPKVGETMKSSKLFIAGMVLGQALAVPAFAALTTAQQKQLAEIQATCNAFPSQTFKEICLKNKLQEAGLAGSSTSAPAPQAQPTKPVAPVQPAKPAAPAVVIVPAKPAEPAKPAAPAKPIITVEDVQEPIVLNDPNAKDTDGEDDDKLDNDEKQEEQLNQFQSVQQATAFDLAQAIINFGFMHTKQNCKIIEPSGLQHKPTYCAMEDTTPSTELSGMVKNINEQLDSVKDNAATARVSVAYFSFSNKLVQKKLCELSKAGVNIRVFLDGGSSGTLDQLIMTNPDCKDASGRLNVRLSYLGGHTDGGAGGIWRLHHNKFLMIDPGTGEKVKMNFSSGNLSTFGTSLHLDHWVTMEAPRNSNIIKAQKCVMEGLEKAAQINDDEAESSAGNGTDLDQAITQGYISTRESCFDANNVKPRVSGGSVDTQIAQILEKEQIAPLFSPNNNSYVERAFISSIRKLKSGQYMYIAIQHFLHGGVKSALLDAASRGVDVRLIMDDDALRGESEVPGVDKMIKDLINLSGGKIQVRLAETNHGAGGNGAMMHNKLAILNGEMSFSGAGHYTNAALRNNWENFYFVTSKSVLKSYAKYFKYLWSQSVDLKYTESKGATPSQAPSALSPKFEQLAQ
jgi:hypothetical protein